MACITFFPGDTVIHRLDPRLRCAMALGFTLLMAFSRHVETLAFGLALGGLLLAGGRVPAMAVARRAAAINGFLFLFVVLMPLSIPGAPLFRIGSLAWSKPGALRALSVVLRANAIVFAFTALLATMEPIQLGHALHRLRAPGKLIHLLLFTIRYIDTLHDEYCRLRVAMRARGFRARFNTHTYRSLGYLIGMLLARSLDRSERVLAAMKCRGFRGQFPLLDRLALARRDWLAGGAFAVALVALGWMEWL